MFKDIYEGIGTIIQFIGLGVIFIGLKLNGSLDCSNILVALPFIMAAIRIIVMVVDYRSKKGYGGVRGGEYKVIDYRKIL
jgi:hypothetical protein